MADMQTSIAMDDFDLEERKREIAYQLWEDQGRPEGKSEEHWSQACFIVMSLDSNNVVKEPEWLLRQATSQDAGAVATVKEAEPSELPIESIRQRIAGRLR